MVYSRTGTRQELVLSMTNKRKKPGLVGTSSRCSRVFDPVYWVLAWQMQKIHAGPVRFVGESKPDSYLRVRSGTGIFLPNSKQRCTNVCFAGTGSEYGQQKSKPGKGGTSSVGSGFGFKYWSEEKPNIMSYPRVGYGQEPVPTFESSDL